MLQGHLPKRVNHKQLASEQGKLAGTISLSSFTRLQEYLLDTQGNVLVELEFHQQGKQPHVLVTGQVKTIVRQRCQRCLAQIEQNLSIALQLVVLARESELLRLAPQEDAVVAEGDHIHLIDLLEDELIINLPMIARHTQGDCDNQPTRSLVHRDQPVYKPFAALQDKY